MQAVPVELKPRKLPIQARSTASVEAILDAAIQVLLAMGKDRLTTTRVAARAGVSVGTLYQYFPNKSSLLQAVLRRHLEAVAGAVESVCEQQRGASLRAMAAALVRAFMEAKMKNPATSVALYSVSADVDGARIGREMGERITTAFATLLKSSGEPLTTDPTLIATTLQGMMAGVSRRILESDAPESQANILRQQLTIAACAYLDACRAF